MNILPQRELNAAETRQLGFLKRVPIRRPQGISIRILYCTQGRGARDSSLAGESEVLLAETPLAECELVSFGRAERSIARPGVVVDGFAVFVHETESGSAAEFAGADGPLGFDELGPFSLLG